MRRERAALPLAALGAVLLAAGCASSPARTDYDPFEGVNRKIFWFNLKAQEYVLDPVARVWHLLPDGVEHAVVRFFANLAFPVDLVNNLLQGKPGAAGVQTARFAVNTTVGVLGFFDPASGWGLEPHPEDLGQTLGAWGLASGPYLMLPLWGPSNVRDGIGGSLDWYVSLRPFYLDSLPNVGLAVVEAVNAEALDLEAAEARRASAIDYYVFVRDAWQQLRQAKIHDTVELREEQVEDLYDVPEDD